MRLEATSAGVLADQPLGFVEMLALGVQGMG
jgi:hypothetical protein